MAFSARRPGQRAVSALRQTRPPLPTKSIVQSSRILVSRISLSRMQLVGAPTISAAGRGAGRLSEAALATKPAAQDPAPKVEIVAGYRPGLVARITEMHANYYAREAGFGQRFETVVAGGLAAFCDRLDAPVNAIWTAVQDGRIVGSIAIDGEDYGPSISHLRWFIVDDSLRGTGVGRHLLTQAMAFVDAQFHETCLWTFKGLDAARHLYESFGFRLASEAGGEQWGSRVVEQKFIRAKA